MKYYKPLSQETQVTGQKIITYKIDWDSETKEDIYFKEEVMASHLLITLDNRTDEEALELINKIKTEATPENFAELAKEYSEGPSSVNGGSLGWFVKGQMVKEFEDVAFSLESGEISEPLKTQFGYHIIYVEDKITK